MNLREQTKLIDVASEPSSRKLSLEEQKAKRSYMPVELSRRQELIR